jgi:hypothetical protein
MAAINAQAIVGAGLPWCSVGDRLGLINRIFKLSKILLSIANTDGGRTPFELAMPWANSVWFQHRPIYRLSLPMAALVRRAAKTAGNNLWQQLGDLH